MSLCLLAACSEADDIRDRIDRQNERLAALENLVEQVNGNSILISESNVAGLYTITYRTLYNPGRFWYVH